MTNDIGGTITVGVDGSECSIEALRWALAEGARRDALVHAILVWEPPLPLPYRPLDVTVDGHLREAAEQTLRLASAKAAEGTKRTDPLPRLKLEVLRGQAAAILVDAADASDLLVVGSRGHGEFRGLLLGSVSQQCAHHARCPIVIVHHQVQPAARPRIVVGVDGSAGSRRALVWAVDEARRRGARLDVVHAWTGPSVVGAGLAFTHYPYVELEESATAVLEASIASVDVQGVEVHRIRASGSPPWMLARAAEGAELLVVGSRGRGGFARLILGSVSQQCAHHAPCPVVIVPSAPEEADA